MSTLEIFVHGGCKSEPGALALANEIRLEFPSWRVIIHHCEGDRARTLGILITPAFVLNGALVAVGVPRKEWLIRILLQGQ